MAAAALPMRTGATASLLRLSSPTLFSSSRFTTVFTMQLTSPLFPSWGLAIPAAISLNIPSLPSILEGLWEGILKAVPKKKTSHSKKRMRQMAGKALKDVNSFCKCPACGGIKRMHHLCTSCMTKLANVMRKQAREAKTANETDMETK